jgi:hypothetical protein
MYGTRIRPKKKERISLDMLPAAPSPMGDCALLIRFDPRYVGAVSRKVEVLLPFGRTYWWGKDKKKNDNPSSSRGRKALRLFLLKPLLLLLHTNKLLLLGLLPKTEVKKDQS